MVGDGLNRVRDNLPVSAWRPIHDAEARQGTA